MMYAAVKFVSDELNSYLTRKLPSKGASKTLVSLIESARDKVTLANIEAVNDALKILPANVATLSDEHKPVANAAATALEEAARKAQESAGLPFRGGLAKIADQQSDAKVKEVFSKDNTLSDGDSKNTVLAVATLAQNAAASALQSADELLVPRVDTSCGRGNNSG